MLQSGNIDTFLGKHSTRNSASEADLKLKEGSNRILTMFILIREPISLMYGFLSQMCRVPLIRELSTETMFDMSSGEFLPSPTVISIAIAAVVYMHKNYRFIV